MEKIKHNTSSKVLVAIPIVAAVIYVAFYTVGYILDGEMSLTLIFFSAVISLILPIPMLGISIAALVTARKAKSSGAARTGWRTALSIVEIAGCAALSIFWTAMFIYDSIAPYQ